MRPGLRCPACAGPTEVSDSRPVADRLAIRRRRECHDCEVRFTTIEVALPEEGVVIIPAAGSRAPTVTNLGLYAAVITQRMEDAVRKAVSEATKMIQ